MAENKRVTYLIGAGASANALPVVNNMNDRIELFINRIGSKDKDNRDRYIFKSNTVENPLALFKEIKDHYTIDTLAKKYFLKYSSEENTAYLKNFLASYFYFEQVDNQKDSILRFLMAEAIKNKPDDSDKIKDLYLMVNKNLDYRYDSFYAYYLQKLSGINHLVLPNEINIISWNYDSQFEIAYGRYCSNNETLTDIQKKLQVYPNQQGANIDEKNSCIIKLNGSATFRSDIGLNKDDTDLLNTKPITSFLSNLSLIVNNKEEINRTNIKFAWENDTESIKAREIASKILARSDVVVVVGYSFPSFNRNVDRQIFQIFNENYNKQLYSNAKRKIYIQDTENNAPKIKDRLKAVGSNLFDVAEIYDDVDQFFIPPEL
ncbi:MAG: hypothetical protein IPM95_09240 [Sphingobacteriales bacterium]|nr:hypothetical protein [Sphingobacteriales bacterium]